MLDDDPGLARDDALHLEPHGALRARLEPPMVRVVTAASSGRRSTVSRISSSSTPRARHISRICPPHTMVGTDSASIKGSYAIGCPMPIRSRTEVSWSYVE
ncbi:hypothetical protein SMD44_08760 [Streptomyces alboflavus]|uniref:Uncharacterized protein n=1 Tax=Streptomyces alboflavus TaxID=67267 RepID=A0A1Z1WS53_9ACTN|nr:hypothetical protein SMD44_08760 [Streptomyces alboflavus]